jgi:hypothetical protein
MIDPAREGETPAWPCVPGARICRARAWSPVFEGAMVTPSRRHGDTFTSDRSGSAGTISIAITLA